MFDIQQYHTHERWLVHVTTGTTNIISLQQNLPVVFWGGTLQDDRVAFIDVAKISISNKCFPPLLPGEGKMGGQDQPLNRC